MSSKPMGSTESTSISPSSIGYRPPTVTCGRIQMRTLQVISPRRTPSRSRFVKSIRGPPPRSPARESPSLRSGGFQARLQPPVRNEEADGDGGGQEQEVPGEGSPVAHLADNEREERGRERAADQPLGVVD